MDGVYSVEALMKNPTSTQAQRVPEFILDSQGSTEVFRQHSQRLTRIELRLLEHLFQHEGCLVPRLELLQAVWAALVTVESPTVNSHIVRLRRKLRAIGTQVFVIETVWGLGYRFRCCPRSKERSKEV
jgi:DNA-binding response OmpR family regulator